MKFTQRIPGGVDLGNETPISFTFETLEELLSSEYVRRFATSIPTSTFYRFSLCEITPHYHGDKFDTSLMVEYNNGEFWWCVGHIDHGKNLALPRWEPSKGKE